MNYFTMAIASIILFILSGVGVRLFGKYALNKGLCDIPNERSSHSIKTPRGAGIIFVGLWLIASYLGYYFGFLDFEKVLPLMLGTVLVSLLGYWDDHRHISPNIRLPIQLLVSACSVYFINGFSVMQFQLFEGLVVELSIFWFVLSVLGIVWSINLFNFMDGTDGLAGCEAIFVLGLGGFLFYLYGATSMALLAFAMVLPVSGFLMWNLPKAKVFMGDVGSYCLGFLIAIFALIGEVWYKIPILLWFILYGVFWFDATTTLIRRILYRRRFMDGHSEHAYQRLYKAGFSHRQLLVYVSLLNIILGSLTLYAAYHPTKLALSFFVTMLILSTSYYIIENIKPMLRNGT